MAGGQWDAQNKIQPGIYINFKSSPTTLATIGARGIVAIAQDLDWGVSGDLTSITSIPDVFNKLGYEIGNEKMRFIQQILRGSNRTTGAQQVLVYRLPTTGGVQASGEIGPLTITAKYIGVRGNSISIVISPNLDSETSTTGVYAIFTVDTIVDGVIRDSQTIGSFTSSTVNTPAVVEDLVNNSWVNFSGTGVITPSAGLTLANGANGALAADAYAQFLTALEPRAFTVLCYDGTDQVVKTSMVSFVKRLGYGNGRYSQFVCADYPTADEPMVTSVKQGMQLNDGTILTAEQATWWVAGLEAGASGSQGLTYAVHPDAIAPVPRLGSTELDAAITEGSLAFIDEFDSVKILSDINTFTSFNPDMGKVYSKNRTVRVVFTMANDIYRTFALYYIGQVDNTVEGRNLFKAEVIAYLVGLQGNGAIQNFTADDVEVLPGEDVDSIVINIWIQVVGAVEKVYASITVSTQLIAA